jgi:TolB-like protein
VFVTPDSTIRSLAVLPLLDLSAARDREYFADGMTEALIAELSRLPDLKVISRTSAMTYKGSSRTLPDIARRLGVDAVVEGSVSVDHDRVRVTAQLIDARTDRHLWAENYERSLDETLALQAELASAIAQQVEAKLTPQQAARWRAPGRVDRSAQDAYLRGRHFWNQRTREGFAKARDSFEAAVAADPSYALAHAGLADTYGLMSIQGYDLVPPQEAMSRAREEAKRALELDDSLAEPHASLAWVNFNYDWDFAAAEREFKRAITLNPGYATAHQWYANLLCILGRFDEASLEIGRALELDPLSRVINNEAGWPLGYLGHHEEAIAQYRRALDLDPQYPTPHLAMGLEYEDMGRYEDAIAEYRTFERLGVDGRRLRGPRRGQARAAGRSDDDPAYPRGRRPHRLRLAVRVRARVRRPRRPRGDVRGVRQGGRRPLGLSALPGGRCGVAGVSLRPALRRAAGAYRAARRLEPRRPRRATSGLR